MKNIYITYDFQWLNNWHNDSRYSLSYFIEQEAVDFIQTNFPQFDTQANYKALYSLNIQEVLDDSKYNVWVTKRFAVVSFDDTTSTEQQLLIGMQDVFTFMWIERLGNTAQARSWLDSNTLLTKINNTTYEVTPEITEVTLGETYPAQYLYL